MLKLANKVITRITERNDHLLVLRHFHPESAVIHPKPRVWI